MSRQLAAPLAWMLLFQWLLGFGHCLVRIQAAMAAAAPLVIEVCGAEGLIRLVLDAEGPEMPDASVPELPCCAPGTAFALLPPATAEPGPVTAWRAAPSVPLPPRRAIAPPRAPPQQPRAPPFA